MVGSNSTLQNRLVGWRSPPLINTCSGHRLFDVGFLTYTYDFSHQAASNASTEVRSFNISTQPIPGSYSVPLNFPESATLQTIDNQGNQNEPRNHHVPSSCVDSLNTLVNDRLQSQDSFGMWANQIMSDSPCSVDGSALGSSISTVDKSYSSLVVENQQPSLPEQIFNLTDVFPAWVSSTEKSKVSLSFVCVSTY